MIEAIQQIINFLKSLGNSVFPFVVVNEHEFYTILSFGKFNRTLEKGFHLKVPFVETFLIYIRTIKSYSLGMNLITKDNITVEVDLIFQYKISDPEKALKNFGTEEYSILDEVSRKYLFREACKHNFSDLKTIDTKISKIVEKDMVKFGIEVISFCFGSFKVNIMDIFFMRLKDNTNALGIVENILKK